MMLKFDPDAVRRNARAATVEDLLDRVTAYRAGMEPEAIEIIEAELDRRGVGPGVIEQHVAARGPEVLLRPEGFAYRCSYCDRPAVVRRWGWHWLWGCLPVTPCVQNYCARHASPS